MPAHLLFPLFSSITFVLGIMLAKQAISRGASPWTGTALANFWLAGMWIAFGIVRGDWLPIAGWWQAGLVGAAFLAGQLCTYFAFHFGDVSVATPVFGVKVLIVALMVATMAGDAVSNRVWAGAVLATLGVVFVQSGSSSANAVTRSRMWRTIALTLLAATALSLFDVGLQVWGRTWGAERFLPVTFAATGMLSCALLPWMDSRRRLIELGVQRPLLLGTLLMALQAVSMSWSLSAFGDATRINIVYALRGLWSVLFAWSLARWFGTSEANVPRQIMLRRLLGAVLLTGSVVLAMG